MSQRVDVQSALDTLYRARVEGSALRVLRDYIETLEGQARKVVEDADDSELYSDGGARVTWTSLNAMRATINYPRPAYVPKE